MRWTLPIFRGLELLGLSLWIGGMLTLGALVAPTIFNNVTPAEMAGEAMSIIFRKFNGGLVYGCIVLVIIGYAGKSLLLDQKHKIHWIEGFLLLLMVVSGIYIGSMLGPRMQELRQIRLTDPSNTGAVVDFNRGHRLSERLFTLNLILGFGVLFMNARELTVIKKK